MKLRRAIVRGLPAGQGWGPALDGRHNVRLEGDRVVADLELDGESLVVSAPVSSSVLLFERPPAVKPAAQPDHASETASKTAQHQEAVDQGEAYLKSPHAWGPKRSKTKAKRVTRAKDARNDSSG